MHIKIEIVGPGLSVNKPAALVLKALQDAGFNVDLEEFDGQYQGTTKENWVEDNIKRRSGGSPVSINVVALPWGG